jgi:hypothetical protein
LALALSVVSCVTGEAIARLEPGMRKAEVVDVLGRPDGFKTSGEYESLQYTNRLISGWSWDRADYFVILKNGLVVEYGPGGVRQRDPNSTVLMLVPTP